MYIQNWLAVTLDPWPTDPFPSLHQVQLVRSVVRQRRVRSLDNDRRRRCWGRYTTKNRNRWTTRSSKNRRWKLA